MDQLERERVLYAAAQREREQIATECVCKFDGYCPRWGKVMSGRLREICACQNIEPKAARTYIQNWEMQAMRRGWYGFMICAECDKPAACHADWRIENGLQKTQGAS